MVGIAVKFIIKSIAHMTPIDDHTREVLYIVLFLSIAIGGIILLYVTAADGLKDGSYY